MKTVKHYSICTFLILIFVLVTGCKSTDHALKINSKESLDGIDYIVYPEERIDFPSESDGESLDVLTKKDEFSDSDGDYYIFLRLYNPKYKKASLSGFLQNCLETMEFNDVTGSHLAIGFDLTDNFYGLTLYAKPNFKLEECENVKSNEYMKTCDPELSVQSLFAYKTTKDEYEKAKDIVEKCIETGCMTYAADKNFAIAWDTVWRKASSDKKSKHKLHIRKKRKIQLNNELVFDKKHKFVCSSAIGFILDESVASIHDYFEENDIDYEFMLPTDYANIPGLEPLFTSRWKDFNESAAKFSRMDSRMKRYVIKHEENISEMLASEK